VTHFTTVARRLKALLLLGAYLDANYRAVAVAPRALERSDPLTK